VAPNRHPSGPPPSQLDTWCSRRVEATPQTLMIASKNFIYINTPKFISYFELKELT